jgi:VRR-NUC domain
MAIKFSYLVWKALKADERNKQLRRKIMGLNPDELPDSVKNKIADPAEKKRVGPTLPEQTAKRDKRLESKLRGEVIGFAVRHGIIVDTANPSRRSTLANGRPDLLLTKDRRCLYMELKTGYNKLSPEQKDYIGKLTEAGNRVEVVRDYPTATSIILEFFGL